MGTLMVSISGVRGIVGNGLDPYTLVTYTSAFADFVKEGKVIIGRDARISGEMVDQIVTGTLLAKGIDVIDIGICPTPTVQFHVKRLNASGGIAISASHNPNEWNALKLLNNTGQFLSPDEFKIMIKFLDDSSRKFNGWDQLGKKTEYSEGLQNHIKSIFNLKLIDKSFIAKKKFKVVADCVNGAGAYVIPQFLKELGCEVIELNCDKTGIFPRDPEPLTENLSEIMQAVKTHKADLGIVVDPDVDRLVLITDTGEPFIEENTITQVVKFVLSKKPGNVVINLSTTRAVEDVAREYKSTVYRSAVGEANVVKKMKEVNAVIGGEGSGGVIYPELHYGRDALVGIALTLQQLAESGMKLSEMKSSLPSYFIIKKKIILDKIEPDTVLDLIKNKFKDENVNSEDGIRIDFDPHHWVHFRKSNTEPIIRVIVEASDEKTASELAEMYIKLIKQDLND